MALPEFRYQLLFFLPCLLALYWADIVSRIVPDPYLDEVFHVNQARRYIEDNQWHVWDPKITTPPGLYLVSWLPVKVEQLLARSAIESRSYRRTNVLASFALAWVLWELTCKLSGFRQSHDRPRSGHSGAQERQTWQMVHTVANILLFPPLFFFYGLYYTDVLSVLSVLLTYLLDLQNNQIGVIVMGLVSLGFRQTNVFWVAIYLGAMQLAKVLPHGKEVYELPAKRPNQGTMAEHWKDICVYDPPVEVALFEDYVQSFASYVVATLAYLPKVIRAVYPSLVIVSTFCGLVVWNDGVVLGMFIFFARMSGDIDRFKPGDKSNHVARIHLAQLLYLWPYITFFSLPIILPYLAFILLPQRFLHLPFAFSKLQQPKPRLSIAILTMTLMTAIVHFNTIIHPFTLADNRHYTFYVFRIILRHPSIKYLAVPVYFVCCWVVLTALGAPVSPSINSTSTTQQARTQQNSKPAYDSSDREDYRPHTFWLIVWLATTSLSLCTAPLVEPRYCILPWIIWRLHVPYDTRFPKKKSAEPKASVMQHVYNYRLWLETLWFLTINAVTGYIFLFWGFDWPQEPGKTQRFMW